MTEGIGRFSCDCVGTGFYGDRCQHRKYFLGPVFHYHLNKEHSNQDLHCL